MGRRRIEMHQYRQVLVRMRHGDFDRELARSHYMGRHKLAMLRALAEHRAGSRLMPRCARTPRSPHRWGHPDRLRRRCLALTDTAR
jgi:hypothetical protein